MKRDCDHTWLCLKLLHATPTEERQVDMTVIVNQYQQILLALTGKKSTELPVIVEGVAVLSKILDVSRASELKAALAKNGMIECLMSVLNGCQVYRVKQSQTSVFWLFSPNEINQGGKFRFLCTLVGS